MLVSLLLALLVNLASAAEGWKDSLTVCVCEAEQVKKLMLSLEKIIEL